MAIGQGAKQLASATCWDKLGLMMDTYRTKQVGDLFGISPQTVKNWAAEFAEFLSPDATPKSGTARNFTPSDLEVFALVSEMRNKRHLADDILHTLRAGERGDIPMIPYRLPAITPPQLTKLQNHITDLENQLRAAEDKSKEFEGQVNLLKEQLADARSEIRTLYKQLAELEANQDSP